MKLFSAVLAFLAVALAAAPVEARTVRYLPGKNYVMTVDIPESWIAKEEGGNLSLDSSNGSVAIFVSGADKDYAGESLDSCMLKIAKAAAKSAGMTLESGPARSGNVTVAAYSGYDYAWSLKNDNGTVTLKTRLIDLPGDFVIAFSRMTMPASTAPAIAESDNILRSLAVSPSLAATSPLAARQINYADEGFVLTAQVPAGWTDDYDSSGNRTLASPDSTIMFVFTIVKADARETVESIATEGLQIASAAPPRNLGATRISRYAGNSYVTTMMGGQNKDVPLDVKITVVSLGGQIFTSVTLVHAQGLPKSALASADEIMKSVRIAPDH